jgi:hypothetical protein
MTTLPADTRRISISSGTSAVITCKKTSETTRQGIPTSFLQHPRSAHTARVNTIQPGRVAPFSPRRDSPVLGPLPHLAQLRLPHVLKVLTPHFEIQIEGHSKGFGHDILLRRRRRRNHPSYAPPNLYLPLLSFSPIQHSAAACLRGAPRDDRGKHLVTTHSTRIRCLSKATIAHNEQPRAHALNPQPSP